MFPRAGLDATPPGAAGASRLKREPSSAAPSLQGEVTEGAFMSHRKGLCAQRRCRGRGHQSCINEVVNNPT